MLNSFNFAIEHGVFHRDSLISLLLKKGKDPLDCSSYRPISLIPCDLKIYAKVFASRMEKVIHSLIKEEQTGFIKGRNASDNMRRLLHILDFADSHPTPCAVFSLDAEKAFDRLEWCNAFVERKDTHTSELSATTNSLGLKKFSSLSASHKIDRQTAPHPTGWPISCHAFGLSS